VLDFTINNSFGISLRVSTFKGERKLRLAKLFVDLLLVELETAGIN
jgi:hypothetical protein